MSKRKGEAKNVVDAKRACASSALNFKELPLIQSAVESTTATEYSCFTPLPKTDEGALEFRIDKTDCYTDLTRAHLYLKVQIVKGDGTKLGVDDSCTFINNIGYALFESVDLFISDQRVTKPESLYAYWTYIYNMFFYSKEATKLYLESGNLWYPDEAQKFDTVDLLGDSVNQGMKDRQSVCGDSKPVWLCSRLMLNSAISRLLPSQTEITLRFNRSPTNFCLVAPAGGDYRIKIMDAKLQANRVKLFDAAAAQFDKILNSSGFYYPGNNPTVRAKTISSGDQNMDWTPFTGKLPQRVYLWMTHQAAYNGALHKNPYNFATFGISRLQLFKNGTSLPGSQGLTNLKGSTNYLKFFMVSAGSINNPETFKVSLNEYSGGYFVVVLDVSADFSAGCDYDNIDEYGSLRIAVDFEQPLSSTVTFFCMGETQETFKLDHNRNPSFLE